MFGNSIVEETIQLPNLHG